MSECQSGSAGASFVLPADPNDDTTALDAWLRPLGWCVEPDIVRARPGYLRLRPLVTADPDGGRTFAPGTTVRWTGHDITRVAPAVPGPLRPLLGLIGHPAT
ncbi:hypothetical protein SAMN05216371_8262 [Streptomyces sp. TLI_053]|uniref:hypothetical protein n=1 Tax=Streptomyces sp. TLI_053 TaxID=1855352 RepID=UPI00087C2D55|nr:hypothetical protein [Streptomyces sp. TLI_053]SDT83434.1 hypothetical protein SAMN05216371_8262 [Streptomyces sp. TLI_053]